MIVVKCEFNRHDCNDSAHASTKHIVSLCYDFHIPIHGYVMHSHPIHSELLQHNYTWGFEQIHLSLLKGVPNSFDAPPAQSALRRALSAVISSSPVLGRGESVQAVVSSSGCSYNQSAVNAAPKLKSALRLANRMPAVVSGKSIVERQLLTRYRITQGDARRRHQCSSEKYLRTAVMEISWVGYGTVVSASSVRNIVTAAMMPEVGRRCGTHTGERTLCH